MAAMTAQELTKGWEFKQTDGEEWLPVARVPTNVHLDLMDNQK
jgi:beta-mannosidase